MENLAHCGDDGACLHDNGIYAIASIRDTSYLERAHSCRDEAALLEWRTDFVAMRDRKMCSASGGLDDKAHALVLSRADLSGVERISEIPAIWDYAWRLAMDIVPDGKDIFLVVNSKYSRSQDWLHVHVMEGSAAGLEARRRQRPESFGATLMQIDSLDQLPKAVEALTGHALSTGEFSILVVGKKAVGNAKERLQVLVERIPECTFDNTERFYVR
jgi:hypothetical protein